MPRRQRTVHAPPADGLPTQLLRELARRHGIHVGGSTLVRDDDGQVRNAFFLAGPDGAIVGRHDKDIPTMWENALYIGGDDPGLFDTSGVTVGVALCWELMRTQTAERLAGRVDLVLSGSGWWTSGAPTYRAKAAGASSARRWLEACRRRVKARGGHSGMLHHLTEGRIVLVPGKETGAASSGAHRSRVLRLLEALMAAR